MNNIMEKIKSAFFSGKKKAEEAQSDINDKVDDINQRYHKKKDEKVTEAKERADQIISDAEEKKKELSQDSRVQEAVEKTREVKDKANTRLDQGLDELNSEANTKENLSTFNVTNSSGNTIKIRAENESKAVQEALDLNHGKKLSNLTVEKEES